MKIVCDSCQAKYSIPDDKVTGKTFKIRCKKCSHVIVVKGAEGGEPVRMTASAMQAVGAAAPAAAPADGWHIVVDGEQVGPLPEADVRGRLARGELNGETYIWRDGFADWVKISTLREFAGAVPAAAAPVEEDPFAGQPTAVMGNEALGGMMGGMMGGAAAPAAQPMFASPAAAPAAQPMFASPAAAPAAQPMFASASVPAASAPGGDIDVFGAAGAVAGPGGYDLFASPAAAPAASASGGFGFGAAAPAAGFGMGASVGMGAYAGGPAAAGNGAGAAAAPASNLTGTRNESSVLFSLSNLEQLAKPMSPGKAMALPAAAPVAEGSGLIDIRGMAAMTLGGKASAPAARASADLPTFAAPVLSPVAPVLLPPVSSSGGMPKWVFAIIGVAVLAVAGSAIVLVKVLKAPPSAPVVVAAPPAAAPAPAAPVVAAPAAAAAPAQPAETPPPAADEKLPPREGVVARPAAARPSARPAAGGARAAAPAAPPPTATAALTPPPPAEPDKKAPAKGSLDDLLGQALGGGKSAPSPPRASAPAPAATPPATATGPLSRQDVVKGMTAITPKATACYEKFKVPGMVMVNMKIGTSGRVESANATGKFAGTPSGDCVEEAVKSAKFPPSAGLSLQWPISLR